MQGEKMYDESYVDLSTLRVDVDDDTTGRRERE